MYKCTCAKVSGGSYHVEVVGRLATDEVQEQDARVHRRQPETTCIYSKRRDIVRILGVVLEQEQVPVLIPGSSCSDNFSQQISDQHHGQGIDSSSMTSSYGVALINQSP